MAMKFSGKDYTGGGDYVLLDPGTYEVTLKSANMYKNNLYQSEELTEQISLVWDTGLIIENNSGVEVEASINDSFLKFSLNEKANLVKRLKALLGAGFDPETAEVEIELDGVDDLDDLKHWRDGRTEVTKFIVNGENIFGKTAIITLGHKQKGDKVYATVENVSAPLQVRKATVKRQAPAGAPL